MNSMQKLHSVILYINTMDLKWSSNDVIRGEYIFSFDSGCLTEILPFSPLISKAPKYVDKVRKVSKYKDFLILCQWLPEVWKP